MTLPPDTAMTDPPRVLVMGASGRLGRLLRAGWRGRGDLAVLWQYRVDAPEGGLIWDPLAAPVPDAGRVDAVLGLAGVVAGDAAMLARNTDLARAAVAAGRALGARQVFLSSTAAVYGAGGPHPETAPPDPRSDYARAKHAMECAVADMPGCTVLRIGNVVGADMLAGAAARGAVTLDRFADGRGPRRSYIGPGAFAGVLAGLVHRAAAGGRLPGVVNLAAPGAVAMADLLVAAGHDWHWRPAPATALPALTLDVTRLAGLVPLAPADPAAMVAEWRALA